MTKPGNMALAGVKVLELEGEPETLESTICVICYPKSQVVDIFYILGIFGCIPIPRSQSHVDIHPFGVLILQKMLSHEVLGLAL